MTGVKRAGMVAMSGAAALLLMGCSNASDAYSDLEGDRAGEDALPAISDGVLESLDPETSRFVGTSEGTQLWLAEATEPSAAVCLVIMPESGNWVTGCGVDFALGGPGGRFHVRQDGVPKPEDMTQVSANVFRVE